MAEVYSLSAGCSCYRSLFLQPEDYKFSSAKFYESGGDDPTGIGFGFFTHHFQPGHSGKLAYFKNDKVTDW